MPSSKPREERKPRSLQVRAEAEAKKRAARTAAVKALGRKLERHDPAKLGRSNVATSEAGNPPTLGASEVYRAGRLTKEGRRGARVVRPLTVNLASARAIAVMNAAHERTIAEGKRVLPSHVIAEALAAAGIGGELEDGETAPP